MMMTMPSTWVILVNYNGAEDTIECIRSLQATKMDNMRILIVDNASKEQDKEKLQTVLDDKVECLFLPENFGFGVANNKGVAYALSKDAEYLLLLNNDTIVSQDLFFMTVPIKIEYLSLLFIIMIALLNFGMQEVRFPVGRGHLCTERK